MNNWHATTLRQSSVYQFLVVGKRLCRSSMNLVEGVQTSHIGVQGCWIAAQAPHMQDKKSVNGEKLRILTKLKFWWYQTSGLYARMV